MPVLTTPTQLFLDGRWCDAAGSETFAVVNPATGAGLVRVADAVEADATAAVAAAAAAQPGWAGRTPRERAAVLHRAHALVIDATEELARLITAESGKPLTDARSEVAYGAEFLRWFGEEAVRVGGRYGPSPDGRGQMIVTRAPVGVSYLVTPWNFPLAMATRKIAPALAAGCTCVIKPAAATPLTTLALAAILHEAGAPHGVVNAVPSSRAAAISRTVLADERVAKLSFTGSTEVGRVLLRESAQQVQRTSMELGGNAPFIVFEDADIRSAVAGAMVAKFRNSGQACTAANRFLVHRDVAEEFTAALVAEVERLRVGPGDQEGVDVGPLISPAAVDRVAALVDDALAHGATLRTSRALPKNLPATGSYLAPTVLSNVAPQSRIVGEEIFGPVVTIMTFSDEEEAVTLANDTEYGLVSYVYTRDLARGHRLLTSLESGMTGVNIGMVSDPAAPFGGVKQSGLGREGGHEGLEEYQSVRYAVIGAG
ncbi:NAD-dependent succinate-semialdehyde dehydrogenase [Pseudactinotalea suaedae]|uniref:NAD-dependent succinate-semialdehyde dehydrogenase n=1 Tax=Pseudactinotalea suaedae TaxID=1524924 RepID=UPI0012E317AE|nr:NAD-dependent succinate-semialdehyde dehydrogenase [Pseudactinotalea suaedae]